MKELSPYAPRWMRADRSERAALGVHDAALQLPNGQRITLVAPSREQVVGMAAQMDRLAGRPEPLDIDQAPDEDHLWTAVDEAIHHIESMVRGHDAFDLMTMLRQYLMPPDLALWAEGGSSLVDSWSGAEVVALVLLGHGLPTRDPDISTPTAKIVPELASAGAAVVGLASIQATMRYGKESPTTPARDGLATMALQLSTHETSVRGRQYESVAQHINDVVLRTPRTEGAFQAVLGFTYDEVLDTRRALIKVVGAGWEHAYDTLAEGARAGRPPTDGEGAAVSAIYETPSILQQVTAEQVSSEGGPCVDAVRQILDRFSARPDERTPDALVCAFVEAKNPLAGVAMLHRPSDRSYLPLPGAIGLDEIRRRCEAPIKGTPRWTAYGRARDKAVETLVADAFEELLAGRADQHRNLRYRDPLDSPDLSPASDVHRDAPVAEADCLLVLDGVAFCVEVKAGDLRPRARQGGLAQLEGDLTKTIADAANQADRLRSLIEEHGGLWLETGTWLDLGNVHEIYSVVVCLDDLGPLSLSTAEMVRADVLPQAQLPWVVSVHDLLVVRDILHRPEHFLTYVRRRTSRDAALWITGSDELDILMWFVSGGFCFVPDPDRIHANYPGSKPPTSRMRREYSDQGRTLVGTFTDPLDAYYYWTEGTSSHAAACPRRQDLPPLLLQIVEEMRSHNAPGWLRAAADFDGYAPDAQQQMATRIAHTVDRFAKDGDFHTFTIGDTDDSGRWIFIFAAGQNTASNRDHLEQYLTAKKHQQRADRALGVLLDSSGSLHGTGWLSYPPFDDPELDALARAMRLVPPDRAPCVMPPKAKASRKAKGKKKGRRRRRR